MKRWDRRPVEIRNLFNPAFCGVVLLRALLAFQEEDARGMPFSLSLLILPMSLHKPSRELLRKGNRSYFLKLVASHPELQVGFARRTTDMLPFSLEALGFLMQLGQLRVAPGGLLLAEAGALKKSITGTDETISCQRVARYLGREFARVGDRTTLYLSMGVRP